jgi:hypothetical protein
MQNIAVVIGECDTILFAHYFHHSEKVACLSWCRGVVLEVVMVKKAVRRPPQLYRVCYWAAWGGRQSSVWGYGANFRLTNLPSAKNVIIYPKY